MFVDRLISSIRKKNNPTVVGLDPRIEYVPSFLKDKSFLEYGKNLKGVTEAILTFNKAIIDAVHDIVPAVKPQLAYYEMYGIEGIHVFEQTVLYAKEKGLLIIADGKRNDIGTTAEAYSAAFLGRAFLDEGLQVPIFDVDALTITPYLGTDGVKPFISDCKKYEKGIFILAKTSNKSSGELQDVTCVGGEKVYELVADLICDWGKELIGSSGYSSVGVVVGATYPQQALALRKRMPHSYFLVPGYGAQGGTASDVKNSFNEDGLGAIVNASRSIMCAYQSEKWKTKYSSECFREACRAEALAMRDELNSVINQ